jgi:glutathione S-transferase
VGLLVLDLAPQDLHCGTSMWRVFHFPFCPFSRKVRLLLSEKRIPFELVRVDPWVENEEFTRLSHWGSMPVVQRADMSVTLAHSRAISEYFEETSGKAPLIAGTALMRAEVRRLVAGFDERLYKQVTAPLLRERLIKRVVSLTPPNSNEVRNAMRHARRHLEEIDVRVRNRRWLAGEDITLADLAAGAQLSVVDYLSGLDWAGYEDAHGWYMLLKRRASFKPLLLDKLSGIVAPDHYARVAP